MTARPEPRILAIILNWRQPHVTLDCVRALRAQDEPALDILVIDNGSADSSPTILRQSSEDFELVELPHNLGFAAGNNHGLRMALARDYDYALLINNDAFAAPRLLSHLLAETADDVALLSPKICYESEPDRLWFAGGDRNPVTLDLVNTGRGELDVAGRFASRDVSYVLGACLLVNLAAVRAVGLLDERYFFYFEDLDWSLRFTEAGYRLRFVADAQVFHRVATSTGGEKDTPLRRYYLAFGSVVFWRQHAHVGKPGVIAGFRLLSAVKMVARLLVSGRPQTAAAYLRGLRDGWLASKRGRPAAGLQSGD
jgi:GT2 family glycosyltransferase